MKISRIETKEQFDQISVSKGFSKKRFLVVDGALPSIEWEAIMLQQRILLLECQRSEGVSIAHLLVPSKKVAGAQPISVIMEKNLNRLLVQFNAIGWLTCCRWLCDVFREILKTFAPDDSEEYTLQALMEDFQHEVFSIVLQQETGEMMEALAKQGLPGANYLAIEKELVRKREALLVHLNNQKALLDKILACLEIVTQDHLQLAFLKSQVSSLLNAYGEPISADPFKNEKLNVFLSSFAKNLNAAIVFT